MEPCTIISKEEDKSPAMFGDEKTENSIAENQRALMENSRAAEEEKPIFASVKEVSVASLKLKTLFPFGFMGESFFPTWMYVAMALLFTAVFIAGLVLSAFTSFGKRDF